MTGQGDPEANPPAQVRRSWTDVGPRLASAAVLIALTATALTVGSYLFAIVVGAVYALAYREWETMVTRAPLTGQGVVLIVLTGISGLLYLPFGFWGPLVTLLVSIGLIQAMEREHAVWRMVGVALFVALITSILVMRGAEATGIWAGVYLGTVVWMTDSAAFFTGRQIGGEKLAPDISPSKTWSGALGGLALGTGAGVLVWLWLTESPIWIGVLLSASISILGQAGDLAESAIKRFFRIKDSGDIIPGHGGLMDRLDSLTFGVFLVVLVGGLHAGFGSVAEGLLNW
ncbi:phosphatidate cytidylyltransferase [uncultured Devosia sp.]|uniref:phosphatidate cytidylyltransferase n=1 Tax=uncultured Devosia sp. TaxID=211434 RepID=UPI00261C01B7|nr:phosphatidate cytidylyltransferase [uncultured Devosia sp.]